MWHERNQKHWNAFKRAAIKKFRIDAAEIDKMVAHLPQRGSTSSKGIGNEDDSQVLPLDLCVPVLNKYFALYRGSDGIERLFSVNERREVALQLSDNLVRQVVHDQVKEKAGKIPTARYLEAAVDVWRRETAPIKDEPEPFCFENEDKLCFKRFPWMPVRGEHPAWGQFLNRLSDPDGFMAFVGSVFDKQNRSRQYLWLRGEGQDGKSTVLAAIQNCLGVAATSVNNTFLSKANQFFYSALYGRRAVFYPDCKNPKLGMSEFIRNSTSGDFVPVEFKGKTTFAARMYVKLFIASNMPPEVSSQKADQSRMILIEVAPSKEKDDPSWASRLETELPAFLFSCQEVYARLCPRRGDIRVSDRSKELQEAAAAAFEERFHDVFDRYFVVDGSATTEAARVRAVLQEDAKFSNHEIGDFKAWVERTHGVKYRVTKTERRYSGLAIRPRTAGGFFNK
jgi:putative DNA primase/helicase